MKASLAAFTLFFCLGTAAAAQDAPVRLVNPYNPGQQKAAPPTATAPNAVSLIEPPKSAVEKDQEELRRAFDSQCVREAGGYSCAGDNAAMPSRGMVGPPGYQSTGQIR